MTTLYHATWAKPPARLRRIRAFGLLTCQTSNWVDGLGERKGGGAIYAFAERVDAIRWAHHMEWGSLGMSGLKRTAIVTLEADLGNWEPDPNDPLTQAGYAGAWLRTWQHVPARQIAAVEIVTPAMIRSIVRQAS